MENQALSEKMMADGRNARRTKNARPVGDLLEGVIAPILAQRAAMSYQLLAAWPELVGADKAALTRPERILWPRRAGDNDPFEPGTLVVACDGGSAVAMQHEADQLLERVNAYLGFHAVARMRIVQKPVRQEMRHAREELPLDPDDLRQLRKMLGAVEDSDLRRSLERLGRGMIRKRRADKRE